MGIHPIIGAVTKGVSRVIPAQLILASLLAALAAPAWAARWYEDYEQAVALIDAQGCSPEAIQLLGAAVTDKPRPRLGARTYAARTVDYLPYYHLARANLACDNLELAQQYLAESRSRGVADATALAALEGRITAALAPDPSPTPPPEPTVDVRELAERSSAADDRLAEAQSVLSDLDRALERARAMGRDTSGWRSTRSDLARRFDRAAEERAAGQRDEDLLALADATTRAGDVAAEGRELAATIAAALAPTPTPVVIAAATTAPTPTPPPRRDGVPPSPTPVAPVVPDLLIEASDLYFGGDYPKVLDRLESIPFTTARPRAAALLLRAAAGLAQARLEDGDEATALLAAARRDIAACRELDTVVRPAPDLFPPDVVEAFSAGGR